MIRSTIALTPAGALDLAGEAVRRRRALEQVALDRLAAAGFEEVRPPTFEYEEIFLRAGGSGVAERLLRFIDRDGRSVALRYDFTASVARLAATTFADRAPPLRFCYAGPVFRQEPERGGRAREIRQVGAELLGAAGLAADVELVRLTLGLVRAMGAGDVQLTLGHVGVLAPGLAAVPEGDREALRRWIDRKDRASLTQALAGADPVARSLATLPFVMGRRDVLEAARHREPAAAHPALDHLLALDAALSDAERASVVYDLGEVRGLGYYTGIQFELYADGCGRAVGSGGRYDDLMERFGAPMPAVGVSLDLDLLAERA